MAPELAAAIEAGHRPVKVTPAAEVHTLAATLWHAATGTWPFGYAGGKGPEHPLLGSRVRELIAGRRLPLTVTSQWPDFLAVLRILTSASQVRPTVLRLATLLEGVPSPG
ncbi:hypothetical protein [Streptomyces sp. TLI_105]|uniref:hypothetical protein n=1 Tax=Streptomyces sp. TLI_105 TaxID=1881019 RepID=UPI000896D440|nr:hypothetical protein [Streptomyces sp. TLI_105]SEB87347.1 hypothetical protein SAMN05428939_0956 [Streptomyces sp. TLI_105]